MVRVLKLAARIRRHSTSPRHPCEQEWIFSPRQTGRRTRETSHFPVVRASGRDVETIIVIAHARNNVQDSAPADFFPISSRLGRFWNCSLELIWCLELGF